MNRIWNGSNHPVIRLVCDKRVMHDVSMQQYPRNEEEKTKEVILSPGLVDVTQSETDGRNLQDACETKEGAWELVLQTIEDHEQITGVMDPAADWMDLTGVMRHPQ